MKLIDTHCHLDFQEFVLDFEEVLYRASDVGVSQIIIPAIDLASSRVICELTSRYNQSFAAVGIHPNEARTWVVGTEEILKGLATRARVVAIGEIGLDYYRERAPRELQIEIFREQLSLARQVGLPVVVHNRDATEDVLVILEEWQAQLAEEGNDLSKRPGVLHSFSGGIDAANRAIAANFYLGITGPVTFRNAELLREVVRAVPLEKLLIETDAPFLTPHPYRGTRNEPAYVKLIADKIAEIHQLPVEHVARQTTQNAGDLFQW